MTGMAAALDAARAGSDVVLIEKAPELGGWMARFNHQIPHTPPYRDPVPTVQLLHCLRPSATGGRSRFADGFAAAELLRSDFPERFDVLATTPVRFRHRSDDVDLHATRPIIELDAERRVVAIALNHRSMLAPPVERATAFYDAYLTFQRLVERPELVIERHLDSGEVVAFDNRRVLHARTAFRSDEPRHLQGCYVDIEAVRSAVRLATT